MKKGKGERERERERETTNEAGGMRALPTTTTRFPKLTDVTLNQRGIVVLEGLEKRISTDVTNGVPYLRKGITSSSRETCEV